MERTPGRAARGSVPRTLSRGERPTARRLAGGPKVRLAVESRWRTVPVTVASSGRPTGDLRPPLPLGTRWARIARVVLLGALLLAVGVLALRAQRWRQRRAALAELSLALKILYGVHARHAPRRRRDGGGPDAAHRGGVARSDDEPRGGSPGGRVAATLQGGRRPGARHHRGERDPGGDPAALRVDALLVRARTDPTPADAPGLVDDLLAAVPAARARRPRRDPIRRRAGTSRRHRRLRSRLPRSRRSRSPCARRRTRFRGDRPPHAAPVLLRPEGRRVDVRLHPAARRAAAGGAMRRGRAWIRCRSSATTWREVPGSCGPCMGASICSTRAPRSGGRPGRHGAPFVAADGRALW